MIAPVVTADGPAGSGKSTLGRALARALGLAFIDTGLFYRGVMVAALRAGVDADDAGALAWLAATTVVGVSTDPRAGDEPVTVDGVPAGAALRDPGHARLLASVSGSPAVRTALLEPQRRLAAAGAVAVGRDCGTVVFPEAAVKFYLDAPQAVREQRRREQLRARGGRADQGQMRAEVGDRDRSDLGRTTSPLRAAPEAHLIDTASVDVATMVARALTVCRAAGLDAAPAR